MDLSKKERSLACLHFLLYPGQDMRETLIIPVSNLVPREVAVFLSFNVYVLSLRIMSGAVDILVKNIWMALSILKVTRWWEKQITNLISIINGKM